MWRDREKRKCRKNCKEHCWYRISSDKIFGSIDERVAFANAIVKHVGLLDMETNPDMKSEIVSLPRNERIFLGLFMTSTLRVEAEKNKCPIALDERV